tara:strand:+ start:407 stop:676 length:270 start_codon:yes stop_codon:yes gene_type:complete
MSFFDSKVANELGIDFINVKLQDTLVYRKYRAILLKQYPTKEGMGWPTYLLVKDPDGVFTIIGELKGGIAKGDFRERLAKIISVSSTTN